jgi:hypothetical protein
LGIVGGGAPDDLPGAEGGYGVNTCRTCKHEKRREIEKAIIQGTSFRRIATQYGLSEGAVRRHLRHCLGEKAVEEARAKKDTTGREIVLKKAESLYREAEGTAVQARADKQNGVVLQSVGVRGKILDLEARVRGAYAPIQSEVELGGSLEVSPAEAERFRALLAAVRTEAPERFEMILKRWGVQLPGGGKNDG